jgi:ubiquinone/menaquinone biosynthesis C-methylase UbiE
MQSKPSDKTTAAPPTPERIMQMAWGFSAPLVIEAAVRHGVFDAIDAAGKPLTVDEIAERTHTAPRGVRILLNALVGVGMVDKDPAGYTLVPESAAFLVTTKPAFQGGLFRHVSTRLIPSWLTLSEVVRDGKPKRTRVNQQDDGSAFFEELVEDILPLSFAASQALAREMDRTYGKRPLKALDLASGSGVWGIPMAQANPQTTVTAVDWENVFKVTRRITERFGVGKQFRYVAGDINEVDFGGGAHGGFDVATLGHILHSEGPARSKSLIKKAFAALAPGGTIAIQEFLVNEDRTAPPMGLLFAVNMLVHTDDGDTFSFGEISKWLREAGFENPRTLDAPGPSPLVLATKPR